MNALLLLSSFLAIIDPDVSGDHEFEVFGIGLSKIKIDGNILIDNWNETSPGEAFFSLATAAKRNSINLEKDRSYKFEVEYFFEGKISCNSLWLHAT
jgi:beta-glucosidase